MFWTCSNTFATCFTCILVNNCNTVYDMDRIEWTCFHTVTKSKTSVVAGFWSTIWNKCHSGTILNSCVLIVLICFFTGSGTFYKCCFALAFLCLYSHDLTNLGCNRCSTNRTLIDWSFPFYDSGCKSETSGLFVKNIRAFRQNRRDFPSKCPPFRLLKWRIKSAKHWFRRVDPKVWQMK